MSVKNHLLSSLSGADQAALQPHLEAVDLPLREILELPNKPIKDVYFPTNGIVSVVAVGPGGREIEVGIIGRDGMTGIAVVLGDRQTPNKCFVQIAGTALRISAEALRDEMDKSPSMRSRFLPYVQFFILQTSYTALANGRGTVEQRLARWLLMCNDRIEGDELSLTHEFLSLMLGVRRAGVTTALSDLERQGLIDAQRRVILIIDREGLRDVAAHLYGPPEVEQKRLTGWAGKR